jgi:type II secretory pathway component PulF
MAVFEYRALQRDGAVAEGRVEAGGRQEALAWIEQRGWKAIRLAETQGPQASAGPAGWTARVPWGRNRVPFAALEDFTRSLSSLLAASVPLSRALTILCKETSHPAARAKWQELHDLVIDGVSLADAMSRSPEVFPRV